MASADAKGTRPHFFFETFEGRTLMAIVPVGTPGVLGDNVIAVESASATPENTNQYRYATVLAGTGGAGGNVALNVVPVTGLDSSNPEDAIVVPAIGQGAISNTDVASNFAGDRFVVVYQVTTVTTTPGGPGVPPTTITDANVYAALYNNGAVVGTPTIVNTTTAGQQTDCRVAMDGRGNFIVVWQSTRAQNAIVGRRFNADGAPAGGEFTISATGVEPDVAATNGGAFAVGYSLVTPVTGALPRSEGTYLQIFAARGNAFGDPVLVSPDTFSAPAVGLANNGRGVIAYVTGQGTSRRVVARRFAANGDLVGTQFNASSASDLPALSPQVGVDTAGGFGIGFALSSGGGAGFDAIGFRLFGNNGVARAPDTVIADTQFASDVRFGLAYRIPGTIHIAYAQPGVDDGDPMTPDVGTQGLMQTYVDDTAAGPGEADELPVPTGALLIDASADTDGSRIFVRQTSSDLFVTVDGIETGFSRNTYASLYIRSGIGPDLVRFNENVTVPSIIYTRRGADTIFAGNGDDIIDGGAGNAFTPFQESTIGNAIQARGGSDYIYGGDGPDTLFGGSENDRVVGGPGKNLMYGEDGADQLVGGSRNDFMAGGAGNDTMDGNDGGDRMDGGTGNDSMNGGDGVDRLFGSNGNDYLVGGDANDSISGGRGNDTLLGNLGRDTLVGGANADVLRGGGVTTRDNFQGIRPTREQADVYFYDESDTITGYSFRVLVI